MARTTRRVRSTGAAELPDGPAEHEATIGRPESTGAVESAGTEVETRAPQLDAEFTLRADAPEPFTATVGWLSDEHSFEVDADSPESKVVKAGQRKTPKPAKADPETKSGKSG